MADDFGGALRVIAAMEADSASRARAAGAQARAEASKPGRAAEDQSAVLSVPALGPYLPPTPGEQAAAVVGAELLSRLQALEADRWRVTLPVGGEGR